MCPGAAQVQVLDRGAVVRVPGHRPPGKELVDGQVTMHDVASHQSVFLLHLERTDHLAMLDRRLESRGEARVPVDHACSVPLELLPVRIVRRARRYVVPEGSYQV